MNNTKTSTQNCDSVSQFTVETQPVDFVFVGVFSAKMKAQW